MSQHPDRAYPEPGRRPITRAQLSLEGLRRLPRVVWLLGLASLLCFTSAAAVLLVSDLFEFSWRYQLPALVTLVPAGALGVAVILRLAGAGHRAAAGQPPAGQ